MPSRPDRWRRARLRAFRSAMLCSTKPEPKHLRAASSASRTSASPLRSPPTTRPASSPARPFISTAGTISSISSRRLEAAAQEGCAAYGAPPRAQGGGDVLAPKPDRRRNGKKKMKRKRYEKGNGKRKGQHSHCATVVTA